MGAVRRARTACGTAGVEGEIRQPGLQARRGGGQQHVAGLQVAVYHPGPVEVGEPWEGRGGVPDSPEIGILPRKLSIGKSVIQNNSKIRHESKIGDLPWNL